VVKVVCDPIDHVPALQTVEEVGRYGVDVRGVKGTLRDSASAVVLAMRVLPVLRSHVVAAPCPRSTPLDPPGLVAARSPGPDVPGLNPVPESIPRLSSAIRRPSAGWTALVLRRGGLLRSTPSWRPSMPRTIFSLDTPG
jgi:hypothetical protein